MAVELIIVTGINSAAVDAADALAHGGPAFRLQHMVEPQPLALLRAKGFADTHIAQRNARLIHQVIERVVGQAAFAEPGPDIGGFPVVDRIDVPRVSARRGGGPGFIVGEAKLALRGDGDKPI